MILSSISKKDNPDGETMNDFGILTLYKDGSNTGEKVNLETIVAQDTIAESVSKIRFTYSAAVGRFGNSSVTISSQKLGGILSIDTEYEITQDIDDIVINATSCFTAPD